MSTNYYKLKLPITSIRPERQGGHTHISFWINHGCAGSLTLRNEEVVGFLEIIREDSPSIHVYSGGVERGVVVDILNSLGNVSTMKSIDIRPSDFLISEIGELHQVQNIIIWDKQFLEKEEETWNSILK